LRLVAATNALIYPTHTQSENGYYFATLFAFIFVPLFMTFFWLNTVLAKEIWSRRHVTAAKRNKVLCSEDARRDSMDPQKHITTIEEPNESPETLQRRAERKQRQIRIFKVIVVLMGVFFVCRLPNWGFVLWKLTNDAQENRHWVVGYAFGILVLANCMLNPFLYSFLSETIHLATFLGGLICGFCSPCRRLCKCNDRRPIRSVL